MAQRVVPRFKKPRGLPLLRKWRRHRNLTQEQLVERVSELLGTIATSSISQLENGKQGYSQETLEALAEALNCQTADLLMRDPAAEDANSLIARLRPETRRQAITMLRALAEADRDEKAA